MESQLTKKDLEPIHGQLEALTKQMDKIELALVGNKDLKIKGLAQKVDDHEAYVSKSKQRLGWWTGAAAGIGVGFHQIIEWFKSH